MVQLTVLLRKAQAWLTEKKILKHLGQITVLAILLTSLTKPFTANLHLTLTEGEHRLQITPAFLFTALPLGVAIEELARFGFLAVANLLKKKMSPQKTLIAFLLTATLWNGFTHQTNILSADSPATVAYFATHLALGFYLAWLMAFKGFKATFTVHYLYDFLLMLPNVWT